MCACQIACGEIIHHLIRLRSEIEGKIIKNYRYTDSLNPKFKLSPSCYVCCLVFVSFFQKGCYDIVSAEDTCVGREELRVSVCVCETAARGITAACDDRALGSN